MKKNILITIFVIFNMNSIANADGWLSNIDNEMTRVEVASNGRIWLMRTSIVSVTNEANETCNITQVEFTPPTGHLDIWVSQILTATSAGTAVNIRVWASCNQAAYKLVATRLVLEYN